MPVGIKNAGCFDFDEYYVKRSVIRNCPFTLRGLFGFQLVLFNVQQNDRSFINLRTGAYADSEIFANSLAKIKSEAARLGIKSAVSAGVTFFKDSRKIFRCNTDSAVLNAKSLIVHINAYSALTGIFECV